ncbi:MAG: hypothetical protein M1835_005364 [Candelina submexicana]|nr:MAG: hypothetical protein M1835_005364 [Candelina submexicana]
MGLEGLGTSFLGSLQASLAVLLTIGYGVIASQFNILQESSAKDISKLCIRLFLPALLVSNVGSQLHHDTVIRYVPILIWNLFYTLVSLGIGMIATRLLHLPAWTTPATAFNNTTSLPLLLVQSLDATGILKSLLMSESDSSSDAVMRAKSYFLVNAMIGNSLTFALGPKLLDGEEVPDKHDKAGKKDCTDGYGRQGDEGRIDLESRSSIHTEDQNGNPNPSSSSHDGDRATEETSLLPGVVNRGVRRMQHHSYWQAKYYWDSLPQWAKNTLGFSYAFLNAPLIGAFFGGLIGLVGPLHRAFFSPSEDGGIFRAWLTSSIQNVGDLFAALQLVVVGSKLSRSMRNMKKNEESGAVSWPPMLFVFIVRFVLWPAISISVIWALATRTRLLGDDPILWFSMMLMPTGPPAISLTAMADCTGSSEKEVMAIAKFLTIAYAISPVICFAVVGSLKASQAAISS